MRIALIEDNADLREETARALEAEGYDVWTADSAEACYKKLHHRKAEIAIVDIGLPGEDGYTLINELCEHHKMSIIALTALSEVADRIKSFEAGADYYLSKPVDPEELFAVIRACERRMQLHPGATIEAQKALEWKINTLENTLHSPSGRSIKISSTEMRLLEALVARANETLSKDDLHQIMFPEQSQIDTHRIDVILNRLRAKAREADIKLPVRSVFGRGIAFVTTIR